MPVIDVRERHDERRASVKNGVRTYSHAFIVRTDDLHDSQAVVLSASGVPHYRQPHPDHNEALAQQIDVEPWDNSPKHWKVRVDFSADEGGTPVLPPLSRPPDFNYTSNQYTEPVFMDQSDPPLPYVNSAGTPFETITDRNRSELSISMSRNEAQFSPIDAHKYADTICSHAVYLDGYGYAPGTLLLDMPTAEKQREWYSGIEHVYYRVNRTFRARAGGWNDKLLDVGMDELRMVPGPSGVPIIDRVPVVDGAGIRVSRVWPLDGSGHALPDPSGAPAIIERRPYKSVEWHSFVDAAPAFVDLGDLEFQFLE